MEALSYVNSTFDIASPPPQLATVREKYVAFTRDDALREAYAAPMKWQGDHLWGTVSARKTGLGLLEDEGGCFLVKRGR